MWLRPSTSIRIKPLSAVPCKRSSSLKITSQSQTSSVHTRIFTQHQKFSSASFYNPIRHPEALNPLENIRAPLQKQTLSQEQKQQIYDKIKERVLSNRPQLVNPYAAEIEVKVKSFKSGEPVDTVRFLPEVWNVPLRPDIVQRVVVWQLAKKRMGTHKQKDRSEVRGGGRKPWNQKKQGKARAGSIRSPIWVGGGRALAKRPRDYYYALAKNVRSMGLKIALTSKFLTDKVTVVDDLKLESHKTKHLSKFLTEKGLQEEKLLLVSHEYRIDTNLQRATGNLQNVHVLPVRGINPHSILRADRLFISKEAVNNLQNRLISQKRYKRINTVYE